MGRSNTKKGSSQKSILYTVMIPAVICRILFMVLLLVLIEFFVFLYIQPRIGHYAGRIFSQACQDSELLWKGMGFQKISHDRESYEEMLQKRLEEIPMTVYVMDLGKDGIFENGAVIKDRIVESAENAGEADYREGKEKYHIFWQYAGEPGLVYVGKIRNSDLYADLYTNNWCIVAVWGCLLILEILYSVALARKMYAPLRHVVGHIDSMLMQQECYGNEYELINVVFDRLEANISRMQTTQYRYQQKLKKEMLQKLLYGDGGQIQEEELQEAGICWEKNTFCVASACFNHLENLKRIYSHADMKLFCFALLNILEEYLGSRGLAVYGVENDDYTVSIILQLEEAYEKSDAYKGETFPLENITSIQKLLYDAKLELENILNVFTVFISVGRSVNRQEDLHRSWLDTKYATIYRFTRGDQLITLFTAHMESYESGIQYPWEVEKKLLANMKVARKEAMLTALEDFFTAVQKMAPGEMQWAINQIMTSILRSSMINNFKMKDGSPMDWKNWVNELNATDTKYEMKDVLVRLIKNLSMEEEDSDSAQKKLACSIKMYVDDHFCEDTLSVAEIASCLGYSINYVRQIFKEVCGISVSNYILEKRIEKAQELLVTTNYSSKRVAQMVGYSDNRYFYVVFKKKTGETADNYRKRK